MAKCLSIAPPPPGNVGSSALLSIARVCPLPESCLQLGNAALPPVPLTQQTLGPAERRGILFCRIVIRNTSPEHVADRRRQGSPGIIVLTYTSWNLSRPRQLQVELLCCPFARQAVLYAFLSPCHHCLLPHFPPAFCWCVFSSCPASLS